MSYNIDRWKTKEIRELRISLDDLYDISDDLKSRGWNIDRPEVLDGFGNVRIDLCCEGGVIKGSLVGNNKLLITEFEMYGEGSGRCLHDIIKPAFKNSSGYLRAILIWEGGDSITEMELFNGDFNEREIDL